MPQPIDDHDPRAVRISPDGLITLKPGVDFRAPGHRCANPPPVFRKPSSADWVVQGAKRVPWWLLVGGVFR